MSSLIHVGEQNFIPCPECQTLVEVRMLHDISEYENGLPPSLANPLLSPEASIVRGHCKGCGRTVEAAPAWVEKNGHWVIKGGMFDH